MDYFRLEDIGFKTKIINKPNWGGSTEDIYRILIEIISHEKAVLSMSLPDLETTRHQGANQDPYPDGSVSVTNINCYKFRYTHCYAALAFMDLAYTDKLNSDLTLNTEKVEHIRRLRDMFIGKDDRSSRINLYDSKHIIENWKHIKAIFGHCGGIPYLSDNGITQGSIRSFLSSKKLPLNNKSNLWISHQEMATKVGYNLFWNIENSVKLTF